MTFLQVDRDATLAVFTWGTAHPLVQNFFLAVSVVAVYALPLVLLWIFWRNCPNDRASSLKIFLAAVLSWQVLSRSLGTFLYSMYEFRDRPFVLTGLREFFFERPEKAFPSDHTAVLVAATLAFFGYKYPKIGWLFVAATLLTGFGRVVVGFHYIGDILGGAVIGLMAYLIIRALDQLINRLSARLGWSVGA